MGRVQLKKSNQIKQARQRNFEWFCENLPCTNTKLILPIIVKGADVCWFALPLTYTGDRGKLTSYLEKHGIETRSLFSGDITRHPAYANSKFRISGKLANADSILKHSFWITTHPRLTQSDREYIAEVFTNFFIDEPRVAVIEWKK